jgi:anti-sigma factor RsiW
MAVEMKEGVIGTRHMNPDEIEKYSMGTFSATEAAPFEEHLLVCEVCRAHVEASDAYVAAMRAAAKETRRKGGETKPSTRYDMKASGAASRIS